MCIGRVLVRVQTEWLGPSYAAPDGADDILRLAPVLLERARRAGASSI